MLICMCARMLIRKTTFCCVLFMTVRHVDLLPLIRPRGATERRHALLNLLLYLQWSLNCLRTAAALFPAECMEEEDHFCPPPPPLLTTIVCHCRRRRWTLVMVVAAMAYSMTTTTEVNRYLPPQTSSRNGCRRRRRCHLTVHTKIVINIFNLHDKSSTSFFFLWNHHHRLQLYINFFYFL